MTETTLIRTRVGGDGQTLVLRESPDEIPLSLLVDDPTTDDVLAVTYDGPRRFLDTWRSHAKRPPRNVGVVSVGAAMRATSAAKSGSSATGGPQNVVRGVADPSNPAAVHRAVEGYLDSWPVDGRTVVYFDSLNVLVDHVGAADARAFLDDFLSSLAAHDADSYFCLTPSEHDSDGLRTIRALFDTVVEFDRSESRESPEPSVDDCFAAVRKSLRRRVLDALSETDGGLSTDELTRLVAGAEPTERRSVRISLLQVHLPKLSEYGFVTHDRQYERVTRGPHFDQIRPYLRPDESTSESESEPESDVESES
ncbi:DUF7504 family protein [Halorussus halophilus]|uniref:DUF7504 family protein n=1 Tax=Halorussus halophilus TaxID=2650975 RepID=UPI001300DCB9|nr:hypothetical protein [Halorussus halophilus]